MNALQSAAVLRHADTREFLTREGCWIRELANDPRDPQVSIAEARVDAGVTTRWHRLQGISERYLILEGRGRMELGMGLGLGLGMYLGEAAAQTVGPGDVVLIPPGCAQRITALDDGGLRFLAICQPRFEWSAYEDIDPAP